MADEVKVVVEWKGGELKQLVVDRAVPRALDDTTAAASIYAKGHHPGWHNVTGIAEGSIRGEPARRVAEGWQAEFGSFDVAYFIWLEIGARGRAGDHTIGRAADAEFPKIGDRLARIVAELHL